MFLSLWYSPADPIRSRSGLPFLNYGNPQSFICCSYYAKLLVVMGYQAW